MSPPIMASVRADAMKKRCGLFEASSASESEHGRANSAAARKGSEADEAFVQEYVNDLTHNVHSTADPSAASGSSLQEQVTKVPATGPNLRPVVPGYIKACKGKRWTVKLWKKSDPNQKAYVCYACRSWRCAGDCARANAAQLFARLTASIARVPDFWCFLTLTLDPKRFTSRESMYKRVGKMWANFRKSLKYEFGYDEFFLAFEVSVRAKALHIHAIVRSKNLFAAVSPTPLEVVEKGKPTEGAANVWKTWLKPTAIACGFGFKCDVSAVRDQAAMSGYLVKASAIGELTHTEKKDQLPVDAPKGFRRIRASKGFLVPKLKNEDLSGELIKKPVEHLQAQEFDAQKTAFNYAMHLAEIAPQVAAVQARVADLKRFETTKTPWFPQLRPPASEAGTVSDSFPS